MPGKSFNKSRTGYDFDHDFLPVNYLPREPSIAALRENVCFLLVCDFRYRNIRVPTCPPPRVYRLILDHLAHYEFNSIDRVLLKWLRVLQ